MFLNAAHLTVDTNRQNGAYTPRTGATNGPPNELQKG